MTNLTSRVTKCCNAPVVRHHGREYPDGPIFHINTSWDACNECHDEWPDTLEACECCGEGAEHLKETTLGMWCKECCFSYPAINWREK